MNILNAYAGLGGNRRLWGPEHTVTAIESDEKVAEVYKDLYPDDEVIVADAHEYIRKHHREYDFVWSSPPCQTHSQIRFNIGYRAKRKYRQVEPVYPDLRLYEEILLLAHYYDGKWVVENTVPYYKPLVPGTVTAGHIWWANFMIEPVAKVNRNHRGGTVESLQERKQIDISGYDIPNKRQLLRNCVEPEIGKHVLDCAMRN